MVVRGVLRVSSGVSDPKRPLKVLIMSGRTKREIIPLGACSVGEVSAAGSEEKLGNGLGVLGPV